MAQVKKITVKVERIKGEKDGKKYDFLSFTSNNKKGERCRIKFPRTCTNIPNKEGVYVLSVLATEIKRDSRFVRPTYWVEKVEEYTDYIPEKKENEDF